MNYAQMDDYKWLGIILMALCAWMIFIAHIAKANPIKPQETCNITQTLVIIETDKPEKELTAKQKDVAAIIRDTAKRLKFNNPEYLVNLAKCESSLNPKAINIHGNTPNTSVDRGFISNV